jgi:hypothetical protein
MDTIWIVRLEVIAYIDAAPSTGQLGFINVVASAHTAAEAQAKVVGMVEQHHWLVLSIEHTAIANPDLDYKDDLTDLIDDVIANPSQVLLSTLYSYRPN